MQAQSETWWRLTFQGAIGVIEDVYIIFLTYPMHKMKTLDPSALSPTCHRFNFIE